MADHWDELEARLSRFDADARFEGCSMSEWSGELRLTLTRPDGAPTRSMTYYTKARRAHDAAAELLADVQWGCPGARRTLM
ncbi:MAG: hypothetical protein JO321_07975 [Solirubrobacterales bacterium]|nr:hypothetical protein [Solirubrobacterales bacterium]MBV9164881.1 hypothetical protein [Solirubrobacterales bacterium]MBV9535330.1 hypothetical protein [Solirubrobacterales bacterium]